MAATTAAIGTDIVDTRIAKAPKEFDGDRKKWRHFKVHLLGYIGAVSGDLKQMMKISEELQSPIDHVTLGFTQLQIQLDSKLFVVLLGILTVAVAHGVRNIVVGGEDACRS